MDDEHDEHDEYNAPDGLAICRSVFAGILGIVILAAVIWWAVPKAWAHEAASGWSYPFACCSNYDCREVSEGEDGTVKANEVDGSYTINATGEVIPLGDRRLRNSPDGLHHWCSVAGKADGVTICLFVPPRAY